MIVLAAAMAALATWWFWPTGTSTRLSAILEGSSTTTKLPNSLLIFIKKLRGDSTASNLLRNRTIGAISALAAELHAGNPPTVAIAVTGGDPCVWPHTKAAAESHADIGVALAVDAESNPELRPLLACWLVAVNSGSGLASGIRKLSDSLREAQGIRIQLEAELAGPRATARMLALLPFIGIGLGYLLGAQPLTWLISHPIGWATLVIGISLTALGVWWTAHIAARVEQML